MEDEQKLKLLRLAINNASDFDEAKAYASFIFGFKEPFETRTPPDEEEGCKHGMRPFCTGVEHCKQRSPQL